VILSKKKESVRMFAEGLEKSRAIAGREGRRVEMNQRLVTCDSNGKFTSTSNFRNTFPESNFVDLKICF
jgi:DNA/RNA-binding domain of Phe-tRNA-synthetase-like protein